VRALSPYELYCECDNKSKVDGLKEYFLELIEQYFANKVTRWVAVQQNEFMS
jgi:inositol oxygenase